MLWGMGLNTHGASRDHSSKDLQELLWDAFSRGSVDPEVCLGKHHPDIGLDNAHVSWAVQSLRFNMHYGDFQVLSGNCAKPFCHANSNYVKKMPVAFS